MKSKKITKKLSLNKLTISHLGHVQAGAADQDVTETQPVTGCTCIVTCATHCGTCYATCYNTCAVTCNTCWNRTCPGWTDCAGGLAC